MAIHVLRFMAIYRIYGCFFDGKLMASWLFLFLGNVPTSFERTLYLLGKK
jgi:hypothetical protein